MKTALAGLMIVVAGSASRAATPRAGRRGRAPDTEHGVWCIETAAPDAARPAWSQPRRSSETILIGKWAVPVFFP